MKIVAAKISGRFTQAGQKVKAYFSPTISSIAAMTPISPISPLYWKAPGYVVRDKKDQGFSYGGRQLQRMPARSISARSREFIIVL